MLTITILSAILLICILIYPRAKNLYILIKLGKEKRKEEQTDGRKDAELPDLPHSIVGKSKFNLSQPVPTTTTLAAKEPNIGEDASNFVPDENQEPMAIDVPLEKEVVEDNIDENEEAIELEGLFGKDVHYASGVEISDLGKLKHVIENPSAEIHEKKQAGKILYENKETEIVEKMSSANEETASIISNLIDLHMKSYLKEKEGTDSNHTEVSDEVNDFDVSQFLRTK